MSTRDEMLAEAEALKAEAERIDPEQQAYAGILSRIGMRHSGQPGPAGMVEARQKLSAAFDQVAPVLRENRNVMVDAIGAAAKAAVADLPDDEADRVWQVAGKAAELPGFRDIEGYLGVLARRYDDRAGGVGPAVNSMLKAARGALAKSNPLHASRIQAINHGWETLDAVKPGPDRPNPAQFIFKRP